MVTYEALLQNKQNLLILRVVQYPDVCEEFLLIPGSNLVEKKSESQIFWKKKHAQKK